MEPFIIVFAAVAAGLIILLVLILAFAGWYIFDAYRKLKDSTNEVVDGLIEENKRLRGRILKLEEKEMVRESWIEDIEARLQACLETYGGEQQ